MRKKHYFLAIMVVAVLIVVLNKINDELIPYYAMVHLTAVKDAPAILAIFKSGKVTQMHGVNELFVGWKGLRSLWPLFVPFMFVGSVFGCFVGLQIMRVKKDKEIKDLKASIPVLGMTTLDMAHRKATLDRKAEALEKETRRLEEAWKELQREKRLVDFDKSQFAMLQAEAEEVRNQLSSLKKDLANRLDKITRLEKTIEKLEVRIIDLEREVVELKKENLKLGKENLALAENNTERKKA